MNFIFISPTFPKSYYLFCRELKENGVNVVAIAEDNYEHLHSDLQESICDYIQVCNMHDYDEMYRACATFASRYGKIDWIESNNEYWLKQDAQLRDDFNVNSGIKTDFIDNIKYKSRMKYFYEIAGVKCAQYHLVTTLEEGKEFIGKVGYPVVVKPDNGVGASCTYKLSDEEQLVNFYETKPNVDYIMEQYIDGQIISYDGICDSNSNIIYETAHQFPDSIMDVVNGHTEIYYYSKKEIPAELREVGRKVIAAFQLKSRFFHCEYFKLNRDVEHVGKKGDYIALEVNMRPPGGYTPDMMNFAGNTNVYKIWADMIAFDKTELDTTVKPYSCVYYGRRDEIKHDLEHDDVLVKYGDHLVMSERMPDILSDAMGSMMYTAVFESEDEVLSFIEEMQK